MMSTRRAGHLIDVCIGIMVLVMLVSCVAAYPEQPWWLLFAVAVVLAVVGWTVYRVRGWVWGIWLLFAAGLLSVQAGLVLLMLVLIAMAVIIYEQGLAGGLLAGAVAVGSMALTMALLRAPLGSLLWQSLGNILVMLLGVVGGLLLRQIQSDRTENLRLLSDIRASVDTEKELMLADERSRSARELHDGLGHRLTLIAMNLEYAQRIRDRQPDQAWAEVAGARTAARNTLAYMRRWVRALNPPRESNLVGNAAFEAIADSFRGTGLSVSVSHTGDERELGKAASLFAYRIVQEGLTNVLRHSNADAVEIVLRWGTGDIEIELRDNGGQAEPGEREQSAGFGLRSLKERALELGGTFQACAGEEGMVLTGRVPMGSAV